MDPLYQLIHGMNANEKGYFKKYASLNNDRAYIKLFDAIATMKVYDEKLLLKKLPPVYAKNLSRTKNYLSNNIVRALTNYHEEALPKIAITTLLNETEVLFNRVMFKQAAKRIEKAKTLATDGELFTALFDALTYQGKLCDMGVYSAGDLTSEGIRNEAQQVLNQLNNYLDLVTLNSQQRKISTPSMLFRGSNSETQLKQLQNNSLLVNESAAISIRAKLLFNYTNYFNRMLLQDYQAAVLFAERYLQIIETNKKVYASTPTFLLEAYHMLLQCLQLLEQPERMDFYLKQLQAVPVKNNWMAIMKFQYYSAYALHFYHSQLRKKEFLEAAKQTLQNLKLYDSVTKPDLKLGMYVTLGEGYLKFGNYADAIDVIEKYRQHPPKDVRHDYQNFLMFVYLIAQYESGNTQLVINLVGNVNRFMKRTGEVGEAERLMLKIIDSVVTIPDKRTRNNTITALLIDIKQAAATLGGGRWYDYIMLIEPFVEARNKNIKYHNCILKETATPAPKQAQPA